MTLEKLLSKHTYDEFEKQPSGDLLIGGVLFSMRVGLFMGRPMQAIQADGQFVRMRPAPKRLIPFTKFEFKVLDCKDRDACLYGLGSKPNWPPRAGYSDSYKNSTQK